MNTNEEDNMSSMVWQSQPLEAPRISLEFVRHQVEKLDRGVRQRNYIEYVVAVLTMATWIAFVFLRPGVDWSWPFSLVVRLGTSLVVLAVLYATWQWHRRHQILSIQHSDKVVQSLDGYRAELQRRRDFYIGRWRWYLLPYVPGVSVLLVGGLLFDPGPHRLRRHAVAGLGFLLATLHLWWLDKRGRQKYQRELDALATLDKK